jgi:chromosome partitioning protein
MKTISLINHKGGTGKTTSTLNLGAAIANKGHKVLLVDLDPQANLTEGFGIKDPDISIYDSIRENIKPPILKINQNLSIIPSSIDLSGAELELISVIGREKILTKILKDIKKNYDYVIVDCPPALGLLTINAIVASDTILIPLEAEFFAYKGMDRLIGVIKEVKEHYNDKLEIGGVFITKCNPNRTLTKTIINSVNEHFEEKLFSTNIRINVALSEAQLQGVSVFDYDPTSNGAVDYNDLAEEILKKI